MTDAQNLSLMELITVSDWLKERIGIVNGNLPILEFSKDIDKATEYLNKMLALYDEVDDEIIAALSKRYG